MTEFSAEIAIGISGVALIVSIASLYVTLRRDLFSRRLASIAVRQALHADALNCALEIDAAAELLRDLPPSVIEANSDVVRDMQAMIGEARPSLARIIAKIEALSPSDDAERVESLEAIKVDFQKLKMLITRVSKVPKSLSSGGRPVGRGSDDAARK